MANNETKKVSMIAQVIFWLGIAFIIIGAVVTVISWII